MPDLKDEYEGESHSLPNRTLILREMGIELGELRLTLEMNTLHKGPDVDKRNGHCLKIDMCHILTLLDCLNIIIFIIKNNNVLKEIPTYFHII